MDKDLFLWLAGIVVAIVLAFLGGKVVKTRMTKQTQKTGDHSVAIQSGRDTKIDGEQDG